MHARAHHAVGRVGARHDGEKVRINTFNRATGNRLKRHMVDSITSDIVENKEIARGYSVAKDGYGQVEDNEPAEILIEIEQFAPKATKGTPNKRTLERQGLLATIRASGNDPISFFSDLLQNETAPLELRFEAAKELAPYVHPKLTSIEASAGGMGHEERLAMLTADDEPGHGRAGGRECCAERCLVRGLRRHGARQLRLGPRNPQSVGALSDHQQSQRLGARSAQTVSAR